MASLPHTHVFVSICIWSTFYPTSTPAGKMSFLSSFSFSLGTADLEDIKPLSALAGLTTRLHSFFFFIEMMAWNGS